MTVQNQEVAVEDDKAENAEEVKSQHVRDHTLEDEDVKLGQFHDLDPVEEAEEEKTEDHTLRKSGVIVTRQTVLY